MRAEIRIMALAAALALPGAALGQAAAPSPSGLGSHAAQVLFAKIVVSDIDRSVAFYSRFLGLQPAGPGKGRFDRAAAHIEAPMNVSGNLAEPVVVLVRQAGVSPTKETAKLTTIGIKVADIHATVQSLKQAGYALDMEPGAPREGRLFAVVHDPDGYVVEIAQTPSGAY